MDLNQIGFSNIRLPNDANNYIYTYHPNINKFPEEVFLHEFLHSLERTLEEYGYERPELHDNEKYGYKEEQLIGLKKWYQEYMRCNIYDEENNKYIGLNPIVYKLKPVNKSNFEYSIEINFHNEPNNVFEEIIQIYKTLQNSFKTIKSTYNINIIKENEEYINESV